MLDIFQTENQFMSTAMSNIMCYCFTVLVLTVLVSLLEIIFGLVLILIQLLSFLPYSGLVNIPGHAYRRLLCT